MARKVTQDDILNINRIYLRTGTYAATARETGFSASTVKRYIVNDFVDPEAIEKKEFTGQILPINEIEIVLDLRLAANEEEEIKELWKEISL